jgi:hypothetical protein
LDNLLLMAAFTALGVSAVVFPVNAIAQELVGPDGHLAIDDPAELQNAEAEKIYKSLIAIMSRGYALSDDNTAKTYSKWKRFNKTPYLSSGHGNRYLTNYGNKTAKNYLSIKDGDEMPFGSIVVKDSFTATSDGDVFPGALFIMEKLSEEAHPDTADWRYAMVMPDGSIFGDTTGENPRRMDYCHTCHIGAADTDYLFLLPEDDN